MIKSNEFRQSLEFKITINLGNLVNSNNTTLPMSKEIDIVVFLKSNNDAVLCIKFYVKRPEVVKRRFIL